jgi:competence protein ComEC
MICLLAFTMLFSFYDWQVSRQQRLVVYNVPKQQAIDLIIGRQYQFIGDSVLSADGMLQNFHLKPGRISFGVDKKMDTLAGISRQQMFYQFGEKRIMIIDKALTFEDQPWKINVDVIIFSKNPQLSIDQLTPHFNCREFVFDASNSYRRIEKWQKECDSLHLRCYAVPEKGAFIFNIGI